MQKYPVAVILTALISGAFAGEAEFVMTNDKVVPLSKFLESEPPSKTAPTARALVLKWEDKSKDVVDVVCPSLFMPLLDKKTPYQSELFAQFVIGSAAYQIANPTEKGKLVPQQVAGVRSMAKAYQSLRAQDSKLNIPLLDEYSAHEADGTLDDFLAPLVASACKPAS